MNQIKPLYAGIGLAAAAILASLAAGQVEGAWNPAGLQAASAAPASQRHEQRAAAELWKAVAASGKVESRAPGAGDVSWDRVSRGDRIRPLSHVRTHKRSRATLTRLGDIVLVDPQTEIVLPHRRTGPDGTIRQSSGSVLYEIAPSEGTGVRVVTPLLVAGVKGTVFSVIVDEGYSSVSVMSGNVEVTVLATGEAVDLSAGDMAVFDGERGELEVYRESRREAGELRAEISRNARRSLQRTGSLLDEASASLMEESLDDEGWMELKRLDLSLWSGDRELRREDLDATLEEDRKILANEEDSKLINAGLKQR